MRLPTVSQNGRRKHGAASEATRRAVAKDVGPTLGDDFDSGCVHGPLGRAGRHTTRTGDPEVSQPRPLDADARRPEPDAEKYPADQGLDLQLWPGLADCTWSVLRLDGDLCESTMDALVNLYPGLAPGGWIIVDDYEIPACAQAVDDYRRKEGVTEPILRIDWTGICWQKQG
jgi:hypothetical protein